MTPSQTHDLSEDLTSAYHDHGKGLRTHAFFRVPDRTMSEDLVQDTFAKTWRYLLRGGKIDVMRAFLYHILNHLIVDEYRKQKTVSLDALLEKGFEPSVDLTERLENVLDGRNALQLIQRLPEKYQKVMRMRYIQHLSLHEMSLLVGQSKNTVAVQAYRGLKKLQTLYQPI
ncbi:MAG: RNA polymerase sigma factor [bacterium]